MTAATKRAEQLRLYLTFTRVAFNTCRKVVVSAATLEDKILLGLFTKLEKLFYSLCRTIADNDGTAVSILTRPYYETALILTYLAASHDESDFKEFVRASYMRNKKDWKDILERIKTHDADWTKQESHINEMAQKEGFSPEDVPAKTPRGGWHKEKTHLEVASALDAMTGSFSAKNKGWVAEYLAIFSMYSSSIHTNWLDLKAYHLQQDPNNNSASVARYEDDVEEFIGYCQAMCFGLKACTAIAERYSDNANNDARDIHRLHVRIHAMWEKTLKEAKLGETS